MVNSASVANAWLATGVPGSHNVENALATTSSQPVVDNNHHETLSALGGVKQRLQFVDEIKGVTYNDSSQPIFRLPKSLVRI